MKALVVLSGGQDSSTCVFWALSQFDEVHAITFDYGQTHAIEIESAWSIGKLAGVKSHEFIRVGPLLKSTSPLTDPTQPLERYSSYDEMDKIIGDRIEKTFVPMRNAFFLTLAANHAVALGIDQLVTGVCQADNANYPDCRESFIKAQQDAIREALGQPATRTLAPGFEILTPLMDLSKAESIQLAMRLGTAYYALGFTHTAYDGRYPPAGNDHASVLRAHGFEEAMVPDPLVLRAVDEGLMELPRTANYQHEGANAAVLQHLKAMGMQLAEARRQPDAVAWAGV